MMQTATVDAADVAGLLSRLWWPSLRIGGFVAAAPLASEMTIPKRAKIVLTITLAFLLAPSAPLPPALSIFSASGMLTAVQEMLIGVAIGMMMQLAFEGVTFAGQTISMSMGLGFATLIDPQRGASVPVLGQFVSVMATLAYLAINGHLVLLAALANSFHTLPIGAANVDHDFLLTVATWGARIFETGLAVALPALIALIVVNMALGVITRAAPQLNLFGIGFSITVLCGFFVLAVGLDGIMSSIGTLIDETLRAVVDLTAVRPGAR